MLGTNGKLCKRPKREGKVLVLFVVALPALFSMAGLVLDGAFLLSSYRVSQHVVDAAATAAAAEIQAGGDGAAAAMRYVHDHHGLTDATVTIHHPPVSGPYASSTSHVEVLVERKIPSRFIHLGGADREQTVQSRAVAGMEPATEAAAIHVLDPSPKPFTILNLPLLLPSLPALIGGLEVLGQGCVEIEGSVIVNTRWGGVDENGNRAGESRGAPYGIACMPLLPLTRLKANDIRVTGGVDCERAYGVHDPSRDGGLKANQRPVPDPFRTLPVPTLASDPANVSSTNYGGVTVIGIPLIGPTTVLRPGVYNYISVISGRVRFEPGVYIIRGRDPITQSALSFVAGEIRAEGVLFYITNNSGYSPAGGSVDATDGENGPSWSGIPALLPSVIINSGLVNSRYSGLNSPGSPYHGMLIFQRRQDPRPIVFVQENLLSGSNLSGLVYAKWGHVILAGKGTTNLSFAVGTMRIIALLDCRIDPTYRMPPPTDVYLVE